MNNYARCLHKLGRMGEVDELYRGSLALAQKSGRRDPLQSTNTENNLAVVANDNARYAEAEKLHQHT